MDETTTQDPKTRLDQFAQAPLETRSEIVPVATYLPPAERHGALKVEVARSAAATRATISEMAMLLGERGFYRWPVRNKKKGTTDWVEGVSIKGAMALVKAYKNCRVACPVIVDLGSHWRFHAVFIDFENGIEIERSFIQRKSGGTMGDDAARREDMAFQIGLSKAERNVVVNALELEADILLEECRGSIVDKVGRDIEHYRKVIVERAAERGIDLEPHRGGRRPPGQGLAGHRHGPHHRHDGGHPRRHGDRRGDLSEARRRASRRDRKDQRQARPLRRREGDGQPTGHRCR